LLVIHQILLLTNAPGLELAIVGSWQGKKCQFTFFQVLSSKSYLDHHCSTNRGFFQNIIGSQVFGSLDLIQKVQKYIILKNCYFSAICCGMRHK
jgi:hypothetical protein